MRLLALVIAALLVVACSEREQVVEAGERTYKGKPDTPAWGDGDRASWEAGIKARQLTQNEYGRMGR